MKTLIRFLRHSILEKTIMRTILFSYLLVNLLLLFSLGILSIRDSTRMITDEIIRSSYKVMEQAALGLSFNLEETKRSLVLLAGNYSVVTMMREDENITMENRLQHERNIAEISQGINAFQSLISDVLILGKNGYLNNLDGRKTLRWEYPFAQQQWVKDSFRADGEGNFFSLGVHRQDYYVDHIISRFDQPTLSVVMQVKVFQNEVVGSVIANLDLQKINGLFEQSTYQTKGNIFLIDENRKIIVHQDNDKIGNLLDFQNIQKLYEEKSGNFREKINGEEHLVIHQPTIIAGWKMISTVPMLEITDQSKPLKSNLARILYLCLILNTLMSLVITFRISRPVNRLLATLDRMGADEILYVKPRNYEYRELNHIGIKFKELMSRIELLIKQNYLSQIALKEEELKTLQSQINPHFLFNTFQLLQTEIACGNKGESNHIVLSLSNLFRYSMRISEEVVELERELSNVKDYLYILNKKYNEGITVSYCFPDQDIFQYKMPKLILQPIVENSIRHGFGEDRREGHIQISAVLVKKGLLIVIRDNGKGMDKESFKALNRHIGNTIHKTDNIGLYNVSQRIKLKYGKEYGICVRSKENVHFTVYITLPRVI